MAGSKFEIFQDKADEYRFHLIATNGEIILASQGYDQKSSCLNGIESVKINAANAELVDLSQKETSQETKGKEAVTSKTPKGSAKEKVISKATAFEKGAVETGGSVRGLQGKPKLGSSATRHFEVGMKDKIWGLIGVVLALLTLFVVLKIMVLS